VPEHDKIAAFVGGDQWWDVAVGQVARKRYDCRSSDDICDVVAEGNDAGGTAGPTINHRAFPSGTRIVVLPVVVHEFDVWSSHPECHPSGISNDLGDNDVGRESVSQAGCSKRLFPAAECLQSRVEDQLVGAVGV
jgi:hypothetical protein